MTTDYPRIGRQKSWNWWRSVPFRHRWVLLLVWLVIVSVSCLTIPKHGRVVPGYGVDAMTTAWSIGLYAGPGILATFLTVAVRFRVWGAGANAPVAVLVTATVIQVGHALFCGLWELPWDLLYGGAFVVWLFATWLLLAMLWWWAVDRNLRVALLVAIVGGAVDVGSYMVVLWVMVLFQGH